MNARNTHVCEIIAQKRLTAHLVRLELDVPSELRSTGVPDEWVPLVVPGQYQSRYYTVRSLVDGRLTLDVVLHAEGLVTSWVGADRVGGRPGIGEPRGSFVPPPDARWVVLAGDLTALPAMARTAEELRGRLPVTAYAEVPDAAMPDYLPEAEGVEVHWDVVPAGESRLAETVRGVTWPDGPGYFWMAGESAQMREVRRYVRRELGWDNHHHEVMGYWSGSRGRRTRQVDPGPIWAQGKAQGRSDEEIWAEYDRQRGLP